MTRTWIVALMAATALVPAIATAQDSDQRDRGERVQRERFQPGEGGVQPQREDMERAPRPDRQQPQAQQPQPQQQQQQAQPQPQPQPQQMRDQARGQWNTQRGDRGRQQGWDGERPDRQRGDDGERGRQMEAQAQAQAGTQIQAQRQIQGRGNPGGWSQDRVGRPVGDPPGGFGADQRRDGNRNAQRSGQFDGRGGQWRSDRWGNERRGDAYLQGRQQWNRSDADWRDQARGAQGFADRSAWNRGWRQDGRYNYGSYRNANRGAYRLPRYYAPSRWGSGYRRFAIGVTLNQSLWGQDYWIDDAYDYRLPEAYGPYRWVRYYNDALLVDIRNGRVVDGVYDIFW